MGNWAKLQSPRRVTQVKYSFHCLFIECTLLLVGGANCLLHHLLLEQCNTQIAISHSIDSEAVAITMPQNVGYTVSQPILHSTCKPVNSVDNVQSNTRSLPKTAYAAAAVLSFAMQIIKIYTGCVKSSRRQRAARRNWTEQTDNEFGSLRAVQASWSVVKGRPLPHAIEPDRNFSSNSVSSGSERPDLQAGKHCGDVL